MEQTGDALMNRLYSYAFYALCASVLVASLAFYSAALFVAAALLVFLSALYYASGHIVNNALLRRSLVVEIRNGYRLSSALSSAVRRTGPAYLSVSVASMALRGGEGAGGNEMQSLLESLGEEFEFSIRVREVGKRKLLEGLETRRRMREIALARLPQGAYDRANALRREIAVLDGEISAVRAMAKALDVTVRVSAFARSEDEAEAARLSLASLAHVADSFSAVLKTEYTVLAGEELLAEVG